MSAANCQKLCPIVGALFVSLAGCNTAQNRVLEETFERLYTIEPSSELTIQNGDGAGPGLWLKRERDAGARC